MIIKKQSIAHEVLQEIICSINRGDYLPGEKLPSSDDLAKKYGVGRSSIREALLELQALGVVTLKHGEGTYVCEFSDPQGPLKYVSEVRRMIEVYCVMSTASNFDTKILLELEECINQMEYNFDDANVYMYHDRIFHYKITEATTNPIIMSFLKSIGILFKAIQFSVVNIPGQKERALQEHKAILNALKLKNSELAIRAVNDHHDNILNLWLHFNKKDS